MRGGDAGGDAAAGPSRAGGRKVNVIVQNGECSSVYGARPRSAPLPQVDWRLWSSYRHHCLSTQPHRFHLIDSLWKKRLRSPVSAYI